jgi:hypothetical protein
MNGASPTMQRIKPILEANIQEHMVHKYQEQMDGVTKMAMEADARQKPEVIEGVMAYAAQQVLNANKAWVKQVTRTATGYSGTEESRTGTAEDTNGSCTECC